MWSAILLHEARHRAATARFITARGTVHQKLLGARQSVYNAQAYVSEEAQGAAAIGKQPIEAFGGQSHRNRVEAPPSLVALQTFRTAHIEAEPGCVDHAFGESGDISQAQVQTLAGEGVDDMGRISDQRQALIDKSPGKFELERKGRPPSDSLNGAQLPPEPGFQFLVKRQIVKLHKPFCPMGALGPND